MQSTNKPAPFLTPFAQGDATRTEIPNTTSDPARASQRDGFPPLTGMPPEAGGVPPQLPDFNGAMNQVARVAWWSLVGGRFGFDITFAADAAIGGYPRGAVLPAAALTGDWISTADNNLADPDTTGTNWVPGYHYGATTLTGMSGGTVTLTPAQAAKKVLILSGTLTSALAIVVPAWVYEWTVYNNTGGEAPVTIRTPGRPNVTIPRGTGPVTIRCDGTDVATTTVEIPTASTVTAGVTRYATTGEARQGTVTSAAMTPAADRAALIDYDIPAAQVTSGTFDVARIPGLSADQITSGTFAAARIPAVNINASQVTAGTLPVERGGTGAASWPASAFLVGQDSGAGGIGTLAPDAVRTRIDAAGLSRNNVFSGAQAVRAAGNGDRKLAFQNASGVEVAALTGVTEGGAILGGGSGGSILVRPNGSTNGAGQTQFRTNGNTEFSGSVTASGGFQQGSSRTVKRDIRAVPAREALDMIESVAAVSYAYRPEYRDDGGRRSYGFIAEDLRDAVPEAVVESDGPSPLVVEHSQLIAVLWAAVQHLAARVQELEDHT